MPSAASALLLVVHWNRPADCAATVRAMQAQWPLLDIRVIDNASDPAKLQQLREELGSQAQFVVLPENKGWGPALNVALRDWLERAESEYVLISSHDAKPAEHCLSRLLEAMAADEKIGIACPAYPDYSIAQFSALRGVAQIIEHTPRAPVEEVDVPHGTLMVLRRECLSRIGLFDERYFAYGDEHELGLRARRHGWKVALVWDAVVENPATTTPSEWRSYLFTRNSLLLVHDYAGASSALLRSLLLCGNTGRLALARRQDAFAFSPRARWRGVRDYFAGRFGPPR